MEYCARCNRYFRFLHELESHEDTSPRHNICDLCEEDYPSEADLRDHYLQSPVHDDYCEYCDERFRSVDELMAHGRMDHFVCVPCRSVFATREQFSSHFELRHAQVKVAICTEFPRHSQVNGYICPAPSCRKIFSSVSSMVQHLDSGGCPSHIDRHVINRVVTRFDRNNLITNPSRLIPSLDGYHAPQASATYAATEDTWNGAGFECFFCCREFSRLDSLNMHLQSCVHDDKIYRCSNRVGCGAEFKVLSSLCQHVQSGSCGVQISKYAGEVMDSLTMSMGLLEI